MEIDIQKYLDKLTVYPDGKLFADKTPIWEYARARICPKCGRRWYLTRLGGLVCRKKGCKSVMSPKKLSTILNGK